MRYHLALAIVLSSACTAVAQPFGAAGTEFLVNTTTVGLQYGPDIAYHSSDSFLVVWYGNGPSDSVGVFGQRYGFSQPIGGELRLNTFTTGIQAYLRVGGAPAGTISGPHFVVVWASKDQDGDGYGVFGQRYGAAGPIGPEFQVNVHTTGGEYRPDVALDSNGDFVVVWTQPDADGYGVFGRRYASTGAPEGGVFRVNTYTTGVQAFPAVAKSSSGDFVVVWQSFKEFGTSYDIVGRRFSSTGAPLDDDFRIEATTSEFHGNPSVASVGVDDGFVVAWMSQPTTKEIFARRYDASGAPLTSPFRVNTYTTADQDLPSVAGDSSGNFTVVWRSQNQDGDQAGVYAQRYASSGAPVAVELRVNAYTTGDQGYFPRVAMPSIGSFTVVWNSALQDRSSYGVYGRTFCGLTGDADGDDAITVADVFYLINKLFAGGPNPVHPMDVNGDHVTDVNDVFYLINYLFAGGPAPACIS
jgi:hypothetical protein